jgi:hypothetical protein
MFMPSNNLKLFKIKNQFEAQTLFEVKFTLL